MIAADVAADLDELAQLGSADLAAQYRAELAAPNADRAFVCDKLNGALRSARDVRANPRHFAEVFFALDVEHGRADPAQRDVLVPYSAMQLAGRHRDAALYLARACRRASRMYRRPARRQAWSAMPRPRARARRRRAVRRLARRATADPDGASAKRRVSRSRGGS